VSAPPCNTQMIFHSSNLTSVDRVGASSEGVKTITDILKKDPFPNGFTTSQLFQVAVRQPPTDVPANLKENNLPVMPWEAWAPSHPIRSIRCVPCFSSYSTLFDQFLRLEVLPVLANSAIVKCVIETSPLNIVERDRQQVKYVNGGVKDIKAHETHRAVSYIVLVGVDSPAKCQ
jgi:hypothetical protein